MKIHRCLWIVESRPHLGHPVDLADLVRVVVVQMQSASARVRWIYEVPQGCPQHEAMGRRISPDVSLAESLIFALWRQRIKITNEEEALLLQ
jgi:hypothetical protein